MSCSRFSDELNVKNVKVGHIEAGVGAGSFVRMTSGQVPRPPHDCRQTTRLLLPGRRLSATIPQLAVQALPLICGSIGGSSPPDSLSPVPGNMVAHYVWFAWFCSFFDSRARSSLSAC